MVVDQLNIELLCPRCPDGRNETLMWVKAVSEAPTVEEVDSVEAVYKVVGTKGRAPGTLSKNPIGEAEAGATEIRFQLTSKYNIFRLIMLCVYFSYKSYDCSTLLQTSYLLLFFVNTLHSDYARS